MIEISQHSMMVRVEMELYKLGWTHRFLAKEIGITEQTMCRYFECKRTPRFETIGKIALALGVSTDYLIYGSRIYD